MFRHFAQHDLGAFRNRKAGDSGADGGKRDGAQPAFRRDAQGVGRRASQRPRRGFAAQLHAGRVNHEAGAQLASRGDCRAADRNAADGVALLLDCIAALAPDRPGHAAAQLQIVVRGVDDGVHVHFRQVALLQHDFFADAHPLASLHSAFTHYFAIRFSASSSYPSTISPPRKTTGRRIRLGSPAISCSASSRDGGFSPIFRVR